MSILRKFLLVLALLMPSIALAQSPEGYTYFWLPVKEASPWNETAMDAGCNFLDVFSDDGNVDSNPYTVVDVDPSTSTTCSIKWTRAYPTQADHPNLHYVVVLELENDGTSSCTGGAGGTCVDFDINAVAYLEGFDPPTDAVSSSYYQADLTTVGGDWTSGTCVGGSSDAGNGDACTSNADCTGSTNGICLTDQLFTTINTGNRKPIIADVSGPDTPCDNSCQYKTVQYSLGVNFTDSAAPDHIRILGMYVIINEAT